MLVNDFCFTGSLAHIGEAREYVNKRGEKHSERELVLRDDGRIEQSVLVSLPDTVSLPANVGIGSVLRVHIDCRATQSSKGGYFNNLRVWSLEVLP